MRLTFKHVSASFLVALGVSIGNSAAAITIASYDPDLGSLPSSQGFQAISDNNPPAPTVSDGILHQFRQTGGRGRQFWSTGDVSTFDFSASRYTVEVDLKVYTSDYLPASPSGVRFGYYFGITDNVGKGYIVGVSSAAIALISNNDLVGTLIPFDSTSAFHRYTLTTGISSATLEVDGVQRAIVAYGGNGFLGGAVFGDVTFAGASETDLRSFSVSAVPEPATAFYLVIGIALLAGRELKRRTNVPAARVDA